MRGVRENAFLFTRAQQEEVENLGKSTKIDCGVCVRRRVYTRALHAHCLWKIRKISRSTQLQALNCLFNLAKRKILGALQSGPETLQRRTLLTQKKGGKIPRVFLRGKTNNTHLLFLLQLVLLFCAREQERAISLTTCVLHVEPFKRWPNRSSRGVCGFPENFHLEEARGKT